MSGLGVSRRRPYWFVDLKWIAGLSLAVALSVTLVSYSLAQITAEGPAIDLLTTTTALLYSRQGLDDPTEVDQIRRTLQQNPNQPLQPFPGLAITIRAQDIANLSPRQVRLLVFRKLAEPLYRQGTGGLAAIATDSEVRNTISGGMGPLSLFTAAVHARLATGVRPLALFCALLLIPLVVFSSGFGRLFSPGVVLLVACVPGAILGTLLGRALGESASSKPPPDSAGITGMVTYIAGNTLPPLLRLVSRTYVLGALAGLGLVTLAVILGFARRVFRRATPTANG